MRNPFSAFRDPVRRPRAIIVLAAVAIVLLGLYGTAMTITSTRWFCNDACHNVHADNKNQYYASSHNNVSCMACHYPVQLDPVRFALDRVDKLLDIYPTITGTFELPLNKYSRIGLEMPSEQCLQCHAGGRDDSPGPGMKMDHKAHAEREINCTICHNRVAHRQTPKLTLKGNAYAEDFMTMRACFRCHVLSDPSPAPKYAASGACDTCHTAGFDLTPDDHTVANWVSTGTPVPGAAMSAHAAAAKADAAASGEAKAAWVKDERHFIDEDPRIIMQIIDVDTEKPVDLPPAASIGSCGMCHVKASFCDPCHTRFKVTVN